MDNNSVAVWIGGILALLGVAATVKPVLNWVQPRVHHLVYAMDDSRLEMIGQVSDSLASSSPAESMLETITQTIARTVNLPYVKLETNEGGMSTHGILLDGHETMRTPITYRQETVGWLDVTSRLPNVPLSNREQSLLNSLARQVGITLHAAQLSEALQSSREQLVLTREEERRRIRRDLHDGLGPSLASLRMQLGAVRRLLRTDPDAAEQLIGELQGDVKSATADIRRLVYELRPPLLDELGLVVALRNYKLGDSGLRLEVNAPSPMPNLSAAVEVAVYRIASEAIHNVIKHAGATTCVVDIEIEAGWLILKIEDNGRYFPKSQVSGVGMHAMQERAEELGGTFLIQTAKSGGACISVHLPLGVP